MIVNDDHPTQVFSQRILEPDSVIVYSDRTMCMGLPRKVVSIQDKTAIMDDGRTVRLSGVSDVTVGDWLEVYADIAVAKITASEARSIIQAQQRRDS